MSTDYAILLDKLRAILGINKVTTDEQKKLEFTRPTFNIENVPAAIVTPANVEELRAVLRESSAAKIAVYPVSRGKNWGLGSACPTRAGLILISFELMNNILDYNEALSYITVEPGVTFQQVSEFLKSQGSRLFMPVIGGPSEASLVGNLAEKGDGLGPYGERVTHCAGLTIVTADGEILSSGYGAIQGSKLKPLHKWGLGPNMDGLFMQSNLGIIADATFWLEEKPNHFQSFIFTVSTDCELGKISDVLRSLQQKGVIEPFSLGLWSSWKFAATQAQYLDYNREPGANKGVILAQISSLLKDVSWVAVGALYAPTKKIGQEYRRLISSGIKRFCKKFIVIDSFTANATRFLSPILKALFKLDISLLIDRVYFETVFLGNPTNIGKNSLYWRKKIKPTEFSNPNTDGCGAHWICHAVPYTSADILKATGIARACFERHGYEPNLAYINASERVMHLCIALTYDREIEGEDERAMKCHDELFCSLNNEGYSPYRLGIQSMRMGQLMKSQDALFLKKLKCLIDPNEILAPGRYEP